jgi:hypothetical protein
VREEDRERGYYTETKNATREYISFRFDLISKLFPEFSLSAHLPPSPTLLIGMPPRGGNSKKEIGELRKAEHKEKKKETVNAEKVCAHAWGNLTTVTETTGIKRSV